MSDELRSLARRIRVHTVNMTHWGQSSHVGSGLSIADILAVLYGSVLRVDPENPEWEHRDRMLISKGHAAAAVYAALAESGFVDVQTLRDFYQDGSTLPGHVTWGKVPGVEWSTGSLGHALPVGTGMALSALKRSCPWRVFVLLSDGECDEGSNWEAILFAGHHRLDNLVAIVDYNHLQSLDRTENTLNLEPFADKWRAFNWAVRTVNGHDIEELRDVLSRVPLEPGKPTVVLAETTKGRGVSFMEHGVLWHYRYPHDDELALALKELEGQP